MRKYGNIPPEFWCGCDGRKFRELGPDVQVLAIYLLTCPSSTMTGRYYLALPTAAHETGLSVERLKTALSYLISIGYCVYDEESEVVWVVDAVLSQVSKKPLKSNDNKVKGIEKALKSVPETGLTKEFFQKWGWHLALARYPQRGQEQEQTQGQGQVQDQEQMQVQVQGAIVGAPAPLQNPYEGFALSDEALALIDEVVLLVVAEPAEKKKFLQEIQRMESWKIIGGLRRYLVRGDHRIGKGLTYALAICRQITRAEIENVNSEGQSPRPRTYAQHQDAERRATAARVLHMIQSEKEEQHGGL